jgi:putative endonuclease
MDYYVYILANEKNGTLYIGVTDNLVRRVWEHKQNLIEGFTKKYGVHNLVYYEVHKYINEAILKEKQMKKWNRIWKIKQINKLNPNWDDLYEQITK